MLRLAVGGDETLEISIPKNCTYEVVGPKKVQPHEDIAVAVREALCSPVSSPRLGEMVRPGLKVALIICDNTRYVPQQIMIPEVVRELAMSGIEARDITVVLANGLHKAMSRKEISEMLGVEIAGDLRIINHNAYNNDELIYIGESKKLAVPIILNKVVVESDLRIALGTVEPHLFAGFSGGVKIVSVGVAGRETIAQTHNVKILDDPNTKYADIEGNIFREFLNEVAELVGPIFIVNVVQDSEKKVMGVFAGHPLKAYHRAVEKARSTFEAPVFQQAEVVVSVPRFPKNINLYQATRAANGLVFGGDTIVKKGGLVIVPARCWDGLGGDLYCQELAGVSNPEMFLKKVREVGFAPEGTKAFVLSRIMQHCRVMITDTDIDRDKIEAMHLLYENSVSEALEKIARSYDHFHLMVIPDGVTTIPRLKTQK